MLLIIEAVPISEEKGFKGTNFLIKLFGSGTWYNVILVFKVFKLYAKNSITTILVHCIWCDFKYNVATNHSLSTAYVCVKCFILDLVP